MNLGFDLGFVKSLDEIMGLSGLLLCRLWGVCFIFYVLDVDFRRILKFGIDLRALMVGLAQENCTGRDVVQDAPTV